MNFKRIKKMICMALALPLTLSVACSFGGGDNDAGDDNITQIDESVDAPQNNRPDYSPSMPGQPTEIRTTGDGTFANRPMTLRQMEDINRAPIAVHTENGVFIGWRFLGTDAQDTEFELIRNGEVIARITGATNYLDPLGIMGDVYKIRATRGTVEIDVTEEFVPLADNFLEIDVGYMEGFELNEIAVGDLTGDGQYDFILKRIPRNFWSEDYLNSTIFPIFQAFKMDGTHMWTICMGPNIADTTNMNFLVADLTGQGRAQLVLKTSELATDGTGKVLVPDGREAQDFRHTRVANQNRQYLTEGSEWLSVFCGLTGAEIARTDWIQRGDIAQWGQPGMSETQLHHRAGRHLMAIAYLNGVTPSIVISRGIWHKVALHAYDFCFEQGLTQLWTFSSDDHPEFYSAGFHSLAVADLNFNGKDDIIFGSGIIAHDGTPVFATGMGHGDAMHVGMFLHDYINEWQIVRIYEDVVRYGLEIRQGTTGELLLGVPNDRDGARVIIADIDPRFDGPVVAGGGGTGFFVYHNREWVPWTNPPNHFPMNFRIWWTGDLVEELADGAFIYRFNPEANRMEPIFFAQNSFTINGTKRTPSLQADLFGDWREEYVLASACHSKLRIFTTTHLTDYRIFTLMHDPVYRLSTMWQNNQYAQPPRQGFYLGRHATEVPIPEIFVMRDGERVINPDLAYVIENGTPLDTKVPIYHPNAVDTVIKMDVGSYVLINGVKINIDEITLDLTGFNRHAFASGLIIYTKQPIRPDIAALEEMLLYRMAMVEGREFVQRHMTDNDGTELFVVFEQIFRYYEAGGNAGWAGGIPAPLDVIEVSRSIKGYNANTLRISGTTARGNRNALRRIEEPLTGQVRVSFNWNVGTITGGQSDGQFRLADSNNNIILALSTRSGHELQYATGGRINITAPNDTYIRDWREVGTGFSVADVWHVVTIDIDFDASTLTLTVDNGITAQTIEEITFTNAVDFQAIEVIGIRAQNNFTWSTEVSYIRVSQIINR